MPEPDADPIAQQTAWTPLRPELGANFRTHRLVRRGPRRWELRPALGPKALAGGFAGFGAGGLAVGLLTLGRGPWWLSALAVGFGTLFVASGLFLWRRFPSAVFDRGAGRIAIGADATVPLAQVHALQIVPYEVTAGGERSTYWSFELDLVHTDARRTRVVGHGNLEALRADAGELAGFLDLPLWDGTRTENA